MSRMREDGVLLADALRALGPHADGCAREALERAVLFVEPDVSSWESTKGRVRGHRVRLAMPAALLARVQSSPAAGDALHAAVAAAVGAMGLDALVDLELRWGVTAHPAASPYRGALPTHAEPQTPEALKAALEEYLRAAGRADAADAVAASSVEDMEGEVGLVVGLVDAREGVREAIRIAVAAMLGPRGWRVIAR